MLACVLVLAAPAPLAAAGSDAAPGPDATITLSFRDAPIAEVFETLSRQSRANILLGKGVTGTVSVNLYGVTFDQAIRAIAEAAGYVIERRGRDYFVVLREDAGKDSTGGETEVRTFKVQYTDPEVASELLKKHLSRFGKITALTARKLLVIEDLPSFLERIGKVLHEVDAQPRQILIEARILEITLDADTSYGIDWTVPFTLEGGAGSIGASGLATRGGAGLFIEAVNSNFELFLSALASRGRVRTLSTPKLLVMEDESAQVLIGDRTGFRVTTTINQVTTESIQFVNSGVILKVKAAVDRSGKILLDIHPEVSNTTVTNGIPSVKTTEVTTQFLAADGQKIFIGGLIKHNDSVTRTGVPVLSTLPVVGGLFGHDEKRRTNTETVVLITPHLVDPERRVASGEVASKIERIENTLMLKSDTDLNTVSRLLDDPEPDQRDDPRPAAGPARDEGLTEGR